MILTTQYSRVAAPWGVVCPFKDEDGEHHEVKDGFSELFEVADAAMVGQGQAAMHCPTCGGLWNFVKKTWLSNPVDGSGLPVVKYWSQRVWDSWTDERRDEARGRVPNVEKWLR
jgi:hypothetical protein